MTPFGKITNEEMMSVINEKISFINRDGSLKSDFPNPPATVEEFRAKHRVLMIGPLLKWNDIYEVLKEYSTLPRYLDQTPILFHLDKTSLRTVKLYMEHQKFRKCLRSVIRSEFLMSKLRRQRIISSNMVSDDEDGPLFNTLPVPLRGSGRKMRRNTSWYFQSGSFADLLKREEYLLGDSTIYTTSSNSLTPQPSRDDIINRNEIKVEKQSDEL